MIDTDGYRPNVGIILANSAGQLLWAKRFGQDAWQFPQGGIKQHETPEDALYRELKEEVGLNADQVRLLGATPSWLKYRLPKRMVRRHNQPVCIGQKQKWFLLEILCADQEICFDCSPTPEFDGWQWVSYWYPLRQVVAFKRDVYRRALLEFNSKMPRVLS